MSMTAEKPAKDARRREILDIAFEEFSKKGYAGASMAAIATNSSRRPGAQPALARRDKTSDAACKAPYRAKSAPRPSPVRERPIASVKLSSASSPKCRA